MRKEKNGLGTKGKLVGVTVNKRVGETKEQHQLFNNDGHNGAWTYQHDFKSKPTMGRQF